jgi:hypothetical protein
VYRPAVYLTVVLNGTVSDRLDATREWAAHQASRRSTTRTRLVRQGYTC